MTSIRLTIDVLKTLDYLAKTSRDKQRLDEEKSTHMTRKVNVTLNATKGQAVAHADRYQNKIRKSEQQVHFQSE